MAVKIRDTITGDGKKFEKMLRELGKLEVRVGIQQGSKNEAGVDLVDIAMFNELGTVNSPSRPFLRDSVDTNMDQIDSFLQSMKEVAMRTGSAEAVLKNIGSFQKGLVQNQIVNGNFVKNSEATIRKKGSATPLIDTGHMRQSVNYVIRKKGVSD